MANRGQARPASEPVRFRRTWLAIALVAAVVVAASVAHPFRSSSTPTETRKRTIAPARHRAAAGVVWPANGQAAVQIGRSPVQVGPNQHAAPIASLAKVMTAYLVLRDHPLRVGDEGPTITLTDDDVADTDRRSGQGESVVSIVDGEELSERQALQALLLPSANNIAAVLAEWDAGTTSQFVARMNATARSLGMTSTRYTDPSGYDNATISTAADQLRIVEQAMRVPLFAKIVATPSATLPVAGVVHNTNTLLGRNGFVGVKTGSDSAAGGCFAFRAIRVLRGHRTPITGVVLGQQGHDLIDAGLAAADAMVGGIAGNQAAPRAPQSPPAQAALPSAWRRRRRECSSDAQSR